MQCLNLRERGRQIGLTLAILSAVLSLLAIASTPVQSLIAIAIDLFMVYALTQYRDAFTA